MTTFSLAFSGTNQDDPSVVSWTTPVEGNAVFAEVTERSGAGEATLTISDNNSGVWNELIPHDQELADANARHSMKVFWREVTASDEAFGTITVTGDSTTGGVTTRCSVFEFLPSAAYDWTEGNKNSADTGTGSDGATGLNSGALTDPGGVNNFAISFGAWRTASSGPTAVGFTVHDSAVTTFAGSGSDRAHAIKFTTTGKDLGAINPLMTWSGTGHEAIHGCAVFTDGVIGGGGGGGNPSRLLLTGVG